MQNVSQYVQSNNGAAKVNVTVTTPSMNSNFTMPRVANPNIVLNGCYPAAYYISSFATPMVMKLNQVALASQMNTINRINAEANGEPLPKVQNDNKTVQNGVSVEKQQTPVVNELPIKSEKPVQNVVNNATLPIKSEVTMPKELVSAIEQIAKNAAKSAKPKMELTDHYVRNLESYLNSQDKKLRMMAGQDIIERLQEDSERKDNPALTALTNKMLQDPSAEVRGLSLAALAGNLITGDELTHQLLQGMSKSEGQEADYANKILLRM